MVKVVNFVLCVFYNQKHFFFVLRGANWITCPQMNQSEVRGMLLLRLDWTRWDSPALHGQGVRRQKQDCLSTEEGKTALGKTTNSVCDHRYYSKESCLCYCQVLSDSSANRSFRDPTVF